MNTPKVSVIIPVYNTELYVKDAIASIINQSLKEIEIIVIDDGSTDNSLHIIEQLANEDNRIQIHCQENQGQSVARNLGINKSTGEYLYFMDSDDLLELDALECCYNKCNADELDFVFFDADIISDNNIQLAFDYIRPEIKEKTYNGIDLLNLLIDKELYRSAPWMNFIKRSYLQKINLLFYPGIIHEDELFCTILYSEANRVGRINRPFFKRRLRGNSTITQCYSWKNIIGYATAIEELKKYSSNKQEETQIVINKYLKIVINVVIQNAYRFSLKDKLKMLQHPIVNKNMKLIKAKTLLVFLFKSFIRK